MSGADYRLEDLGDHRLLTVDGQSYRTVYSERLLLMLIERKGPYRAVLYLPYRETRGRYFLEPLFRYLEARGAGALRVLEVGCSFGHMTEYLAAQATVAAVHTFDADPAFIGMTRLKVSELGLDRVRDVALFTNEETCNLPYASGAFDLVVASGVIEHLPLRTRRRQVDEYYRVLALGGHIAILDTPNRAFPLETHSVGLPFVHWLPPRLAYHYARLGRPATYGRLTYKEFMEDGSGWMNASWRECLPSSGWSGLDDVTEEAGYGWRFFRDTARSRTRLALLPAFAVAAAVLRAAGRPPSLCLPYFNLLFRRTRR